MAMGIPLFPKRNLYLHGKIGKTILRNTSTSRFGGPPSFCRQKTLLRERCCRKFAGAALDGATAALHGAPPKIARSCGEDLFMHGICSAEEGEQI